MTGSSHLTQEESSGGSVLLCGLLNQLLCTSSHRLAIYIPARLFTESPIIFDFSLLPGLINMYFASFSSITLNILYFCKQNLNASVMFY